MLPPTVETVGFRTTICMRFVDRNRYLLVPDWQQAIKYVKDNVIINNQIIYRCTSSHISNNFDDDLKNGLWEQISSSGGSGGSSADYKQITKLNITAPKTELISINVTSTFTKPPLEILKFVEGENDVVVTLCDFDNNDSTDFEANEFLTFDGNMSLKTIYDIVVSTPTQLVKGYCSITEDIDLTKFKSVEEMGVVQ